MDSALSSCACSTQAVPLASFSSSVTALVSYVKYAAEECEDFSPSVSDTRVLQHAHLHTLVRQERMNFQDQRIVACDAQLFARSMMIVKISVG
jgi:hypothetical protein